MTIKTIIHSYYFDTSKPADKEAYTALKEKLDELIGLENRMESWGGGSHYIAHFQKSREVDLETEHLFNNQWNTAPIEGVSEKGLRVFDWAQDYQPEGYRRHLKMGHWLEQTPEMKEIRRNTVKCGYCGKQEPAQKGYVFCPHCIDSEYLTEKDLPLTRMRPIDCERGEFAPLTEAEKGYLLPLFREGQLHGVTLRGKARMAKARRDLEAKYKNSLYNAKAEYEGMLWFLDRGLRTDNVIFYDHTGRFSFGWRKPLDKTETSALLDIISEFPYSYDIVTAEGKKLSGER